MESQNINRIFHKHVEIDGLDIFYREAGPKDADTILLLHGFPTSSHMFRNLMQKLSDRFHLVAPDYPGFGNSSMPKVDEFDYTFDNIAEIIDAFIQKIGLKNYSMYVMDYGAPVGYRIAVKHPERVESLIVWGKNDYIFPEEGAHPYKRDLKNIEFHLLDTGHFALEEDGDKIAHLITCFMAKHMDFLSKHPEYRETCAFAA